MNVYEFHLSIEIVVKGSTKFVFGMVLSSVFLDLVFLFFLEGCFLKSSILVFALSSSLKFNLFWFDTSLIESGKKLIAFEWVFFSEVGTQEVVL